MSAPAMDTNLQPLYQSLRAARRRLWWQKGLQALSRSLCAALGLSLLAALLAAWQAPEPLLRWFWMTAALMPLAGLAAAIALRPSTAQAARRVDLRLGLHQQLGTAEELLSGGREGPLVSLQISRASGVARGIEVSRALPLLPRREAALALLLAITTTAAMILVGRGLVLTNPFSSLHLPSLSRETPEAVVQEPFSNVRGGEQAKPSSPAMDQVNQLLDQIQKEAQQNHLSSAATAAALAQASAELNRLANESLARQEALDNLAKELQGTAAGREAAQSLQQGDYDQAAQQIRQMGRQSDQISLPAKQELAEALSRAGDQSPNAQGLSQSEKAAADQLRQGDYSSVTRSTDQLAQSVQDAANRRVSQNELSQTWQRLQQLNQQYGPEGQKDPNALTPPVAQGPQGAGERQGSLQQGGQPQGAPQQGGQGGQQSARLGPTQAGAGNGGGRQPGGGGAPGNSPGGAPLGNQNPRLGPDGNPLEVQGQIAGQFPGDPGGTTEAPSILRQGTGNSAPSAVGGGANGPLSVPGENVLVPGERRPTVRSYFSNGSSGER